MNTIIIKSFILLGLTFLILNCKTDHFQPKPIFIKGNVLNAYTASSMANIPVLLKIIGIRNNQRLNPYDNFVLDTIKTLSDARGNFTFKYTPANSDSISNQYSLVIRSKYENGVSFEGSEVFLDKNLPDSLYVLKVMPHMRSLCFQIMNVYHIVPPDSFRVYAIQNTLHKNLPDNPHYQADGHWTTKIYPKFPVCGCYNYPMGWWSITFDKVKNGKRTSQHDSIYVDYGATATFSMSW